MDVLMPQLGETVAEGTVAQWHKRVGDHVDVDEVLLDVETDKVSMEIPAPGAGTLKAILVEEGATVDVGTVLAVIDTGAEETDAADDQQPQPAATAATAESGDSGAAQERDQRADPPAEAAARPARLERGDGQLRLSPAVRRLVAEHELDVAAIPGSGRNGRITRRDVQTYLDTRAAPTPATRAEPPAARSPVAPRKSTAAGDIVPFNRIRKLTAEHMVRSKATSPHVLQAVEVDFGSVERVRTQMRDAWRARHRFSLTFLPFIAHAACRALAEFPNLNASVEDDALRLHAHVNLAIAVDLGPDDGLVAPVIRRAEALSVEKLAHAIHDLSQNARNNRLRPDDLSGGTYTLSNSGSFGTLITAPIINQPQVAILSIDGIRKKPVVIERPDGDAIAIRPVGILAQSFDHRAVDGAYSAAFLGRVRSLLEQGNWTIEV
jgi:pyruvate dehydrogenase E2 component (dihydrolipoamide acetyltransferase)